MVKDKLLGCGIAAGLFWGASAALGVVQLPSVTLAWTPSSSPNVVGYRLYWGTSSQVYSNLVDVGNVTSAAIGSLTPGVTYYFAATSYDLTGLESPLSSQIIYTVPSPSSQAPVLQLSFGSGRQAALTATAPAGYRYDVLTTSSFTNWTVLGSVTADANGNVQFTDAGAATNRLRFYRLHQTFP